MGASWDECNCPATLISSSRVRNLVHPDTPIRIPQLSPSPKGVCSPNKGPEVSKLLRPATEQGDLLRSAARHTHNASSPLRNHHRPEGPAGVTGSPIYAPFCLARELPTRASPDGHFSRAMAGHFWLVPVPTGCKCSDGPHGVTP